MKNIIRAIFLVLLFANVRSIAQQENVKKETDLVWYTDMVKASEISTASNKPIFAFFTGSDWCMWCKKLQKDVFAKTDFINWAKKNVILVELDFPRGKQLSPELSQQNANLQQTFQVTGFPTVWMFFLTKDGQGNKFNINALGSCGYPQGPEPGKEEIKFLENANLILAKRDVK